MQLYCYVLQLTLPLHEHSWIICLQYLSLSDQLSGGWVKTMPCARVSSAVPINKEQIAKKKKIIKEPEVMIDYVQTLLCKVINK